MYTSTRVELYRLDIIDRYRAISQVICYIPLIDGLNSLDVTHFASVLH